MKFYGSYVALITPFTQKGRVDLRKLEELVRWHCAEGTDGIVCAGSTGEAASLSESERSSILRACVEAAEKKILVLAGTGTSDTKQSVRLTEAAQRRGADGAMVIVPYFNKPTQRGCVLHFQELSRVGLPLMLYNNPGRCAISLKPETVAEIAQFPNIHALKEANGDLTHFSKIRSLTSLPLLAGEDCLTYDMLQLGAVGAVSVVGNILPKLWGKMIRERSQKLFEKTKFLLKALSLETNPQCIKQALALMGKDRGVLRLPLLETTPETKQKIKQALFELCSPYLNVDQMDRRTSP